MDAALDLPHFATPGTNTSTARNERRPHLAEVPPGEPAPVDDGEPGAATHARKPFLLRAALIGGTGLVAVGVVGALIISHHRTAPHAPAPIHTAAVRPASGPAQTTTPASRLAHVGTAVPAPLPTAPAGDLQQLIGMRAEPGQAKSPASTPKAAVTAPAVIAAKPAVVAVAAPAVPTPPVAVSPTPHEIGTPGAASAAPQDAGDRAASLQAAPMAPADQVRVLQLVTEVAQLVKDERQQIANLRSDQQGLRQGVDARLADYERRLSLAEAASAVHAANANAENAVAAASATPTSPPSGSAMPVTAPPAATAAVALGSRQYRIQAASPRLAMLQDVTDGTQVSIAPGDALPGYGKVTAISQYGTSWRVTTDHGTVR